MSKILVCGSLLKVYCFFPKASLFFLVNFACHRIYFTLSREKKVAQFHKKTRDQSQKKNSSVRSVWAVFKIEFLLSPKVCIIFSSIPFSLIYIVSFVEKKSCPRCKKNASKNIVSSQLSKAANRWECGEARLIILLSPPRSKLNRLKHLETVHRRQRISVDLIAEGKYFLFLQRLVDDEIYRLKISNRHFGLRMKIAEQF